MKIAIIGAQGVGKTTLLNALKKDKDFVEFTFCSEVTRWVKSLGFNINEWGSDNTQQLIMMKHVTNVIIHDVMITDRSVFDGFAYTQWLYDKNRINEETYHFCKACFDKVKYNYDYVFYIRPEFEIEDDGVRSSSTEFRDEVEIIFDDLIKNTDRCFFNLTGGVEDRIQQLKHRVFA